MSVDIDIDTATGQRIAPVLAAVQVQYPAANEAYVLTGAVVVGLNFLLDPTYRIVAEDFSDPVGADDTIAVTLADGDSDRATSLASDLGVSVDLVYSAALCTGLARLQGSRQRITGPFSADV